MVPQHDAADDDDQGAGDVPTSDHLRSRIRHLPSGPNGLLDRGALRDGIVRRWIRLRYDADAGDRLLQFLAYL